MNNPCNDNNFCCSLSETTKKRLCKACLHLNLKPKQEIVFEAEANQVAIVHSGVMVSIFRTKEGEEKSLELLKTGDLVGAENLFNRGSQLTQNLLTLTEATLCLFSIPVFETFYQQSPDFSQNLVQSLSRRFRKSLDNLLLLQTTNSEEKVRIVLELLKEENIDVTYITHQDLAMIANLNRVTVTKAIKEINRTD